mmetsp:Transcript_18110/g.49998  ORF Transcript_18110/g.49998 Transcript_18110/m.49998 type:complete len:221 (-) Transcript_18110:7-669(-)
MRALWRWAICNWRRPILVPPVPRWNLQHQHRRRAVVGVRRVPRWGVRHRLRGVCVRGLQQWDILHSARIDKHGLPRMPGWNLPSTLKRLRKQPPHRVSRLLRGDVLHTGGGYRRQRLPRLPRWHVCQPIGLVPGVRDVCAVPRWNLLLVPRRFRLLCLPPRGRARPVHHGCRRHVPSWLRPLPPRRLLQLGGPLRLLALLPGLLLRRQRRRQRIGLPFVP